MTRPARPWFRFYVEAVHDRKVRRLKPEQRWLFVAMLAAARQSPKAGWLYVGDDDPMGWDDLVDVAALTRRQVEQGVAALIEAGVVRRTDECWFFPNWDDRQYESDTSTDRVQRFRERRGNVAKGLPETPPETETDTDTPQTPRGGATSAVPVEDWRLDPPPGAEERERVLDLIKSRRAS
jgi:hypothetical protein